MALDPDRRAALLGAKLAALVREHFDLGAGADPVASGFAGGATVRAGSRGWVLIDERPDRALGPALAWARQQQVDELHVLVEQRAGVVARRAAAFTGPPTVWRVEGRDLVVADPEPFAEPRRPSSRAEQAAALLRAAGVDVVVEHGEVLGEVLGLEIARVVDDEGEPRVEVGVGRHDREAFAMVHGDVPTADALASVVDTVRRHRRADVPGHPLNRLAAERWLRARLVAEPALIGATELWPVEGTVARSNVKESAPAAAVGTDATGAGIVAVASTGIDLDLVPTAADVRLAFAPDARLVLVVPERDDHPVTRALAAALVDPADLVTLPADWRAP